MPSPKTIVVATANKHKHKEFAQLLEPAGYIAQLAESEWTQDIAETGQTFVENALIKARAVTKHTPYPVIADDSGLCVAALNAAPGIYSARFAGQPTDDVRNNEKLLQLLTQQTNRKAWFYCAIVLLTHAQDPCPIIGTGRWEGEIATKASGQAGFGYDPLFYLPLLDKTSAQLSPERKNQLSHRGQAMRQIQTQLNQIAALKIKPDSQA